jgi:hypothetical protein
LNASTQAPDVPSQWSLASSSHEPPFAVPVQCVLASTFGCVQTPAAQTSAVQSFPSVVQAVSSATRLVWQVPLALQVSGLSQSVSLLLPQDVPLALNASTHELLVPVQ